MSIQDHLNLRGVTVNRVTTTMDAYGDPVATTLSTILSKAAIWSLTQTDRRVINADKVVSDRLTPNHVYTLAIKYGEYDFTIDDKTVEYNGATFTLVGLPDNISYQNVLVTHGMERFV